MLRLTQLVADWLSALSGQPTPTPLPPWQQLLALLMAQLRRHRCLLVLDKLESVMQRDGESGRYPAV